MCSIISESAGIADPDENSPLQPDKKADTEKTKKQIILLITAVVKQPQSYDN